MSEDSQECLLLKGYQIPIWIAADHSVCNAIEAFLSLTDIAAHHHVSSSPFSLGITYAHSKSCTFRNNLIRLLNVQCCCILVLWTGSEPDWDDLGWNSIASSLILKKDDPAEFLAEIVKLIRTIATYKVTPIGWRHSRLLNKLQAEALYDRLSVFSHNAESDITNKFLAPARMLLEENQVELANILWVDDKTKKIFAHFKEDVLDNVTVNADRPLYGDIGAMIWEYARCLQEEFNNVSVMNCSNTKGHLEQLMALLTECRLLAGVQIQKNTSNNFSPKDLTSIPNMTSFHPTDDSMRRILVIDDDVLSWRPVLEILKIELGDNVEIYASPDANSYWPLKTIKEGNGADVVRGLPDFDLVLLDIYLKDKDDNDFNGLEFLENIRSRVMHLPVILWTTSSDRELPAKAALANGFLFKKTAKIGDIASIIKLWLSVGNSQRLWSLPNPFFDYALRDPALREVSLAFTKWTLRYMDCFHAVDHFYFKYFNDHGGRHILGVLDTASKLLRPFLFQDSLLNKIISNPDGTRNIEKETEIRNKRLFCLYIAILCHEFGMFPIYEREKPPILTDKQPDKVYWQQMESMRKLHGIRGMLMLRSSVDKSFAQFNIEGLGDYLSFLNGIHDMEVVGEDCCAVIALLVGYHQRCLDLSKTELKFYIDEASFAVINGGSDNKSTESKIKTASTPVTEGKSWTVWDAVMKSTTSAWKDALNSSNSIWDLNSVRGLCAILRFADALDVDHTRVPADFILNDASRRAIQDVEDCKRQVLSSVKIDQGIVSLEFYASKLNDERFETCFIFAKKGFKCIKHKVSILDEKEKEDFTLLLNDGTKNAKELPVFEEVLFDIVNYNLKYKMLGLSIEPWGDQIDISYIEKYLKGILQVYFTCLKYNGLCTIDDEVQSCMATIAALLVILEIKDEYKAITEVGIGSFISPNNNIEWLGDETLPSILKGKK